VAKKTRKQKQRAAAAATRRAPAQAAAPRAAFPSPTPMATQPGAATQPADEAADLDVASVAAEGTGRRRIERLNPAAPSVRTPQRPQRGSSTAAMFRPLESDDAAIPFDRVPYVPADLRRVAVMAACMVLLIIIAAVIVSHVVA
jgi:hypothetical protein